MRVNIHHLYIQKQNHLFACQDVFQGQCWPLMYGQFVLKETNFNILRLSEVILLRLWLNCTKCLCGSHVSKLFCVGDHIPVPAEYTCSKLCTHFCSLQMRKKQ